MKRLGTGASMLALVSLAVSCGARQRPAGPAPEYERPVVTPWDAGVPVDPLTLAEATGEAVEDTPDPDAGQPGDGAAPE